MKESNMSNGNSPAFPCQDNKKQIYTGMNLRDYIAMEALHAIIDGGQGITDFEGEPEWLAKKSYEISDAMLNERVNYQ
jgi:hypothetical protein